MVGSVCSICLSHRTMFLLKAVTEKQKRCSSPSPGWCRGASRRNGDDASVLAASEQALEGKGFKGQGGIGWERDWNPASSTSRAWETEKHARNRVSEGTEKEIYREPKGTLWVCQQKGLRTNGEEPPVLGHREDSITTPALFWFTCHWTFFNTLKC